MKLAIVVPVLNEFDLADTAIDLMSAYLVPYENKNWTTEIIAIDNGSAKPFKRESIHCVYLKKNIGVYPIFWEALKHTDADILAFFHSDLILAEPNWGKRVLEEFAKRPKLGLLGFVGSNEIDNDGGRGHGTTSNFQGNESMRQNADGTKTVWKGSPAGMHGRCSDGYSQAAVVDGCAMIFRKEVLEKIKQRENFPPHHFYDRLLSCETREIGYEIGVLGIACDHISGQTVGANPDYGKEWCEAHNLSMIETWDKTVYLEAERQWLTEYRDVKKLIPCKV